MPRAAPRPRPATTVAAPMRTSPVPKTPGRPVAKVTASAARRRCLVAPTPSAPRDSQSSSGPWPMASSTRSHSMMNSVPATRLRAAPSGGVRRAQRHALELDARDLVVGVRHDARRRGLEDGPGALLDHLVDLVRRGHVLHVAAIDERHLLGALADRGAGAVHGREAAADDHDPLARMARVGQAERRDAQVLEAVEHALGVLAGDAQLVGVVAADGHADGVEALVLEVARS